MTKSGVAVFEKAELQLLHMRAEMDGLSKKSPNDAINKFKLKLINDVLATLTDSLGAPYEPIRGFRQFEEDSLPTNSDVLLVLSQYQAGVDKLREDQTAHSIAVSATVWIVDNKLSDIKTRKRVRLAD